MNSEVGLWLAAIAACAGLALSWRWWAARRGLRNRALRVLGYVKPAGPLLTNGVRYAGVITAAILTVLVLTPAVPGAGDLEPTTEVVPTASPAVTPAVVVVELKGDGATIVVQGNVVEIRLAPSQLTPAATDASDQHNGIIVVHPVATTPPAQALPNGME
ncbi:MAG: hypothetical protein IT317_10625 [Anaerolineales bacterium]|nr:hypothetical protein [Anaerolineales bacterium]